MPKKPSGKATPGGPHKTKRIAVNVPEEWHGIARKLAARRQQPVVYTFIALLREAAEKEGLTDLPVPPWEVDGDES